MARVQNNFEICSRRELLGLAFACWLLCTSILYYCVSASQECPMSGKLGALYGNHSEDEEEGLVCTSTCNKELNVL